MGVSEIGGAVLGDEPPSSELAPVARRLVQTALGIRTLPDVQYPQLSLNDMKIGPSRHAREAENPCIHLMPEEGLEPPTRGL